MKNVEKNLLKMKLDMDGITLANINLDDVIDKYNHIIDFYLEDQSDDKYLYRFSFVYTPNVAYERDEQLYYNIFLKVLFLAKMGTLKYLDDLILLDHFYRNRGVDRLSDLVYCMNEFIDHKFLGDKSFIDTFVMENKYILQDTIVERMHVVHNSKYLTKEYKSIMSKYQHIYNYYRENIEPPTLDDRLVYIAVFSRFLNVSYYYFVINGSFINDYDNVMKFLNKVENNILLIVDKINFSGNLSIKEMFVFVENYFNTERVKVIK